MTGRSIAMIGLIRERRVMVAGTPNITLTFAVRMTANEEWVNNVGMYHHRGAG